MSGSGVMRSGGASWRPEGDGSRRKNSGDCESRRGKRRSAARSGQSVGAAVGKSWRMTSL